MRQFLVFTVLALALTACVAGPTDTTEPPSTPQPSAVSTQASTPMAAQASPTAEQEPKETGSSGFVSECTLVSALPEAPSEFEALFAVTAEDWVDGPDTAALTIVEYGDFQ